MSPLVFFIVIDGQSSRKWESRSRGIIIGFKLSRYVSLTHLMFVDNIILLGKGPLLESQDFSHILEDSREASGFIMNSRKSSLYALDWVSSLARDIDSIFGVESLPLNDGFRYMGFFIKTNQYVNSD